MLLNELTKAGITVERLSEELDMTAGSVKDILTGKDSMTLYEAGVIKKLFATKGISISYEEISERAAD